MSIFHLLPRLSKFGRMIIEFFSEIICSMLKAIIIVPLPATNINKWNSFSLTSRRWKGALCSPHKQRTWFLLYQVKSHPSRIRDILSLGNTLSENITTFSSFWTPLKTMCEIAFLFLFRLNDFVPNNFCKLNEHVTEMNAKTNLLLHFLLFPACNFPSFQFKLKHHPW